MTNENFVQQGWQCPICKTIYSPTTPMCFYCTSKNEVTTYSTVPNIKYTNMKGDEG